MDCPALVATQALKPALLDRNFLCAPVFVLADSLIEFARRRGLNPPLDPQPTELSTEGRAVPDYGAPFNIAILSLI